jgi:hypothetical protein
LQEKDRTKFLNAKIPRPFFEKTAPPKTFNTEDQVFNWSISVLLCAPCVEGFFPATPETL